MCVGVVWGVENGEWKVSRRSAMARDCCLMSDETAAHVSFGISRWAIRPTGPLELRPLLSEPSRTTLFTSSCSPQGWKAVGEEGDKREGRWRMSGCGGGAERSKKVDQHADIQNRRLRRFQKFGTCRHVEDGRPEALYFNSLRTTSGLCGSITSQVQQMETRHGPQICLCASPTNRTCPSKSRVETFRQSPEFREPVFAINRVRARHRPVVFSCPGRGGYGVPCGPILDGLGRHRAAKFVFYLWKGCIITSCAHC